MATSGYDASATSPWEDALRAVALLGTGFVSRRRDGASHGAPR